MSPTIWVILIVTIVAIFSLIILIDRADKRKRRDDRDAVKADDIRRNPDLLDKSQQAAELQVGEDDERRLRSRFQPDANANKKAVPNK